MSIEAMKQALEALALFASDESDEGQVAIAAHEALRQAIEQAEKQKPVAWTNRENLADLKSGVCSHMYAKKEEDEDLPLYAAPQREWAGLKDSEWMNIVNKHNAWQGWSPEKVAISVCKLTETKLKEKNT
jgi:hypothetical protein